ncbi:MAG TPA: GNAT family N-acetyltransferase [Pyrinomonadaceae bacterium]|nr:GNAT family N-acetyltransferase [Pyrinomonadaceae bacterium]
MGGHIRAARADEADALTELALRSKALWGYDARFVADCRAELTVTPRYVREHTVYVCEEEVDGKALADDKAEGSGRVVGFYSLVGKGSSVDLDLLYVEPSAVGRGHGRRLFAHAAETARRLGFRLMTIKADPHAEAFYRAMGAARVGEVDSPVRAGRTLPLLHLPL